MCIIPFPRVFIKNVIPIIIFEYLYLYKKYLMEFTEIITTLITALSSVFVALITAGYLKKWQDRNKENKSRTQLMAQIQKDELIHFSLREIRRKYNADRVYIIQFHNGGNFYTNTPMQKGSVTYERNSDGLERITDKFQNILISNYNWILAETIAGKMFYTNIDEQIDDLPTMSLLKSYGNYAHSMVPIYDNSKNMVATMSLSWVFSDIPNKWIENGDFTSEFQTNFYDDANSLKNYLL